MARIYESLEQFCKKQEDWVQQEHIEEVNQIQALLSNYDLPTLIKFGYALDKLVLLKSKILIKQQLLIFQTQNLQERLRIKQGDQVGISKCVQGAVSFEKPAYTGVIERIRNDKLRILLDKDQWIEDQDEEFKYRIVLQANFATYERHLETIRALRQTKPHEIPLVNVLFEEYKHSQKQIYQLQGQTWRELNPEQLDAVQDALTQESLSLIHGPPGTGKTRTVCEFIKQAVLLKREKILACAPSNIAVDNMIERLDRLCEIGGKNGLRFCRIGNPARTLDSVRACCLDHLAKSTASFKTCKDLKRQLQMLDNQMKKATYQERKNLRAGRKQLLMDLAEQEWLAKQDVIQNCNVIFTTNTGCGQRLFKKLTKNLTFDVVVIDECAQSLEISCWIPLLIGKKKVVLAGDHQQLPPTVKSSCPGLEITLFQRVQQESPASSNLLRRQYRMNEMIMEWSSKSFYQGQLQADLSVAKHTTNDLIQEAQESPLVIVFIDTASCDLHESESQEDQLPEQSHSKYNEGECGLVQIVVEELLILGIKSEQIGVITPYNAQVQLLKKFLSCEVATVDGFQGREKECIIISMVRSNSEKEVGFLSESRRMNVAVTRAKRFVCLIGDSETVSADAMLGELISYFKQAGDHRSAAVYQDDERVRTTMVSNRRTMGQVKEQKKQKKVKQGKQKEKQFEKVQPEKGEQQRQRADPEECVKKSEALVQEFLRSAEEKIVFRNLNSFERQTLHSIAEKYGLIHVSHGEGKLKDLELSKKQSQVEVEAREDDGDEGDEDEKEGRVEPGQEVQAEHQGKDDDRKERGQEEKQVRQTVQGLQKVEQNQRAQEKQQQQAPKKKKSGNQGGQQGQNGKKKAELIDKNNDDFFSSIPDLDPNLCALLINGQKQCYHQINILSLVCRHCEKKFCTNHTQPEKHGCDEAARQAARQQFLQGAQNRDELVQKIGKTISESRKDRSRKKKP